MSDFTNWTHSYVKFIEEKLFEPPSKQLLHSETLPKSISKKTLVLNLDDVLINQTIQV